MKTDILTISSDGSNMEEALAHVFRRFRRRFTDDVPQLRMVNGGL